MELDPKYTKEHTITKKKWNFAKFNYNTQTLRNITDSAKKTKPYTKKQIKIQTLAQNWWEQVVSKVLKLKLKKPISNFYLKIKKRGPFWIFGNKVKKFVCGKNNWWLLWVQWQCHYPFGIWYFFFLLLWINNKLKKILAFWYLSLEREREIDQREIWIWGLTLTNRDAEKSTKRCFRVFYIWSDRYLAAYLFIENWFSHHHFCSKHWENTKKYSLMVVNCRWLMLLLLIFDRN